MEETPRKVPDRNQFIKALRIMGKCIPGDYLKTAFYLNCIKKPRKLLRKFSLSFYRMDQIYDILKEFSRSYEGPFSILEFGTASGYSTVKMLYATRYLKLEDKVTIHAFDSFEGLHATTSNEDLGLIANDWKAGQFHGDLEKLIRYIQDKGYTNYKIHKGYFEDTLTQDVVDIFRVEKPILIWVDCDYYTSAVTVFERLLPVLPTGAVFYFDDYDFNFGSRFTGEARLVHEINTGKFGQDIELLCDTELSLDSKRVYRFINYRENSPDFQRINAEGWKGTPRPIGNGSPMP